MREADLRGKMGARLLLLEVDEATMRRVAPEVAPDMILITNIFRDQLDRFGELYAMARMLEASVEALPARGSVVLNGDDPLVASLAPQAAARRLYFGLCAEDVGTETPEHAADTIRCVRCQRPLTYHRVYASHLGDYECRACGTRRPDLDIAVTRVQESPDGGTDMTVETPAGTVRLHVPLPGLHNVYNAAAALGGTFALGALEPGSAQSALASLRPAFGRLEEIKAGGREAILSMVKNPASYNATLRVILQRPGRKHLLAAHSNTVVDGEDFAWLWDVDLERLVPKLGSLVISGTRAAEVALRMKYAGADRAGMWVIPGCRAARCRPRPHTAGRAAVHPRRLHADARVPPDHAKARLGAAVLGGMTWNTPHRSRYASATSTRGCSAWPGTGGTSSPLPGGAPGGGSKAASSRPTSGRSPTSPSST